MACSQLLVGAIDFGTTFSGWAFSFLHEYKSDPTKVSTKQWHSGSTLISEKTPTCLLIKPDGETLEAFGFEAENKYIELCEDKKVEHEDYYFFKQFKMKLHQQLQNAKMLNKQMVIEDVRGRRLPALTVFSLAIKYLSEDLLKECQKQIKDISASDIHWVLTVPAIWTDAAKQFMRNAAEQGGIPPDRLSIALEPEAASIFAKHMHVVKGSGEASISNFKPGDKYMVLDAGGGTIDITVHEVDNKGGLKEVVAASGGGWGGTLVDKAFEQLMGEVFSDRRFNSFKHKHTGEWMDLMRNFELKKRSVDVEGSSKLRMYIPAALLEMTSNVKEKLKSTRHADTVQLERDSLTLDAPAARDLFSTAVNKTKNHVKQLTSKRELRGLSGILMVGGFSDSPILKESIEKACPGIPIIKPREAGLTILKGAVIFGHNPNTISKRVLQYTYGIRSNAPFKKGVHPESKKRQTDTGEKCRDIFSKHVEVGQTVKVGEPQVEMSYSPAYHDAQSVHIIIYASENRNPTYTDEGCTCVGRFDVDISGDMVGDLDRSVKCRFTFSGTELLVEAEFESTGEVTSGTFAYPE